MKLYVVVIGRKGRHKRYISYDCPLGVAAYLNRSVARQERKKLLQTCGHKDVYVIPFVPER